MLVSFFLFICPFHLFVFQFFIAFPPFLFSFFIALPFSPSFSPVFVSVFFVSCGFHLSPILSCLGLKDLVIVVVECCQLQCPSANILVLLLLCWYLNIACVIIITFFTEILIMTSSCRFLFN
jgi:hypothetical protein